MTQHDELVWTRLHLPRPLDPGRLQSLLLTLGSERKPRPVTLELRSTPDGLQHLLGCEPTSVARLKRLIGDQFPGVIFTGAEDRRVVDEVGRMTLKPPVMPLRTDIAEDVTLNLLSAAATRLGSGEQIVVQVALGRPHSPVPVHPKAVSPRMRWWEPLWNGTTPATADERKALRVRAEDTSFSTTVRVGVSGKDPARTRRLQIAVQSALSSAKAPGVRMEFIREDPKLLASAVVGRGQIELACAELVGLLGWPLGEEELPGIPSPHPKPLRASPAVHSKERVFARSAVSGDERELGVAPSDALLHGVAYGPSGSGKSTAILHLIEADMIAGRPIAVLDPKRQLIDAVLARVPKDRLDDVVVLDAADEPTVGFNPLDVTGRDPDVVVDGILSVFGALFSDGWGPRTADIFSATLRSLARASARTGAAATLADIPRMLTDPNFRRRIVGTVQQDEALASFWAWYEDLSPAAQANAIAAPLNKLRSLLLRPALARMLDQRDARFHLRDIWRDNKIVLVPLNEALIGSGTASMLGSLLVADLWISVQERATERDPLERPGFVYVDEAPRFLHLPTSLADALAVSRSLGVGWYLAAQFVGQFPKEMRSAVDMNARTKLVFATEYEDARHFAKGQKHLNAEDFTSLPRFHAYLNPVADGHPQGWALVATLPPSRPSIRPERVRARSRALWGAARPDPAAPGARPPTGPQAPERADSGPTVDELRVGRTRRTR